MIMSVELSSPGGMNPVETWIKALTQPKDSTYEDIAMDPGASLMKGALWLAGFGFIGGLISGIIRAIFGTSAMQQFSDVFSQYGDMPMDIPVRTGGGFMSVVGGAFGGMFGAVIGALIYVGLVQVIAKMLGGKGNFEKLFYTFAAFAAPLSLITNTVGAIPFVSLCLGFPLAIYGLVLAVMATKASHDLETGQAAIAAIGPGLVLFLLCCCVIIVFGTALTAIMGPAIENIFGNISSNLTYP
jgi:hypothetical protein